MRAKIRTPDGKTTVIDATPAEVERLAGQRGYQVHILAPPPNWLYGDLTTPRAKA